MRDNQDAIFKLERFVVREDRLNSMRIIAKRVSDTKIVCSNDEGDCGKFLALVDVIVDFLEVLLHVLSDGGGRIPKAGHVPDGQIVVRIQLDVFRHTSTGSGRLESGRPKFS